jgi:hypothetical protein
MAAVSCRSQRCSCLHGGAGLTEGGCHRRGAETVVLSGDWLALGVSGQSYLQATSTMAIMPSPMGGPALLKQEHQQQRADTDSYCGADGC